MLEWLIIGGGIHGTHLSNVLVNEAGVARGRVRVLDPYDEPLARWNVCTENTGMAYLRSSVVHHLALHPFDLKHFAERIGARRPFAHPYKRPSLALFSKHCRRVIRRGALNEFRLNGTATALQACESAGFTVETCAGELKARRVALAIGSSGQLQWPDWATRLKRRGAELYHLFEPGFDRQTLASSAHVAVIGGGISAAQVTLALLEDGIGDVTLIRRHPRREHQLDSDPGWIGPKHQEPFRAIDDWDRRRRVVSASRHTGSMPPALARRLAHAHRDGRATVVQKSISRADLSKEGLITLFDGADRAIVSVDRVILSTGFSSRRPGGGWVSKAVRDLGLQCATCGYPIVDESLQWHPGLFVTGPLAELEIGPVSRNIVGARQAAKRIAATA